MAEAKERWPALESSPEVMESFAKKCGASRTVVSDVFGLDPGLLSMVPPNCVGVILLFPSIPGHGREEVAASEKPSGDVFFMEQVPALTNACGTVALIHCLAANAERLGVSENDVLEQWLSEARPLTFHERGVALDKSDALNAVHLEHASQGQTEMVDSSKVQHHFMCFTSINGEVVELDGAYKDGPKSHGKVADGESTLEAAARIIQKNYIDGAESLQFAMLAVCSEE